MANKKANLWQDVRRNQSAEREARVEARVSAEMAKLPLAQVRKAQEMTQERLAEILQVNQGAVSRLEQRTDMFLSTLRSYIEAMGGHLDIRAVFPSGEIVLERLGHTDGAKRPGASVPRSRSYVASASR